jgi:phosphoglycolate phosphatase-like HAD superfamily hydrolase
LDVLRFFNVVLCADKADRPKPYPDMLWALARRLKLDKTEVLYVGDMDIDVDCGHRAGIRVVAVRTGSSSMQELNALKPWAIIAKMGKLKEIIN